MSHVNYTCLKRMLDNANWAHDAMWELGCYDEAIRYTKIAQRILEAMGRNKVYYNYFKTGI